MTARRRPRLGEPLEDFVEAVGRVPTQQLKKALVAVYQGLSPMLASVMASRVTGLTATTKVGDISPEQWSALHSGPWKRWLEIIGDGGGGGLPPSDDGDEAAAAAEGASSSSPPLPEHAASRSYVPTTPWISEDGASYYPTTLGEELEQEQDQLGAGGGAVAAAAAVEGGENGGDTAGSRGGGGGDEG